MVTRKVTAAFETWQVTANHAKHTALLIGSAVKRMLNRKLSASFETWQVTANHAKHTALLIGGAVKRMLNRKLSAAFETWQETANHAKHTSLLIGGAVKRMLNRKLAAAFETWQETANHAKHTALLIGGAVKRMLNRKLSAAFETWQEVVARAQYIDALLQLALNKLRAGKLLEALWSWRIAVAEAVQLERKVKGVITRLQNGKLSAAFEKWQELTVQSKIDAATLRRVWLIRCHAKLCKAWSAWSEYVDACFFNYILQHRGVEAALEIKKYKLEVAFKHWQERSRITSPAQHMGIMLSGADSRRPGQEPGRGVATQCHNIDTCKAPPESVATDSYSKCSAGSPKKWKQALVVAQNALQDLYHVDENDSSHYENRMEGAMAMLLEENRILQERLRVSGVVSSPIGSPLSDTNNQGPMHVNLTEEDLQHTLDSLEDTLQRRRAVVIWLNDHGNAAR